MNTIIRIQNLRATAAQWTSRNPVLAAGEFGVETDTLKVKVGDGSTAWTSLGYINPAGAGTVVQRIEQAITWTYDGISAYYFTWTHNLAANPQVTILDSAGEIVEVQVTHDSVNQLTLDANSAFSGGKIVATY